MSEKNEELMALITIEANHREVDFVCYALDMEEPNDMTGITYNLLWDFAVGLVVNLIFEGKTEAYNHDFGDSAISYVERENLELPEYEEWEDEGD